MHPSMISPEPQGRGGWGMGEGDAGLPWEIRHFWKLPVLFPTHESQICVENPLGGQ